MAASTKRYEIIFLVATEETSRSWIWCTIDADGMGRGLPRSGFARSYERE